MVARFRAGALATRRFGRATTKFTQDARHRSWLKASTELILHPAERRMLPVLDLDPAIGPAAAIGALAVLGDHALQPQQAGVPKQVRPDLALFEGREMDAVDGARNANPKGLCGSRINRRLALGEPASYGRPRNAGSPIRNCQNRRMDRDPLRKGQANCGPARRLGRRHAVRLRAQQ